MVTTRQLRPEDWAPVRPTRIITRKAPEPRDEQLRIPRSARRCRPSPINVAPGENCFMLPLPRSPGHSEDFGESPRDPEIVDLDESNAWPRCGLMSQRQAMRKPSPSATSQYSVGQSEMSYGIIDYYFKDEPSSPNLEMVLSRSTIGTPVIPLEKFDFELPSKSHFMRTSNVSESRYDQLRQDTKSGAVRPTNDLLELSPLPPSTTSQNERKATYRLFPHVRVVTPPRKPTTDQAEFELQQTETPRETITTVPSHQQPGALYRQRKESVSSSFQSRKDSFTSYGGTRSVAMRLSSSSSTPTPKRSTVSNSISTVSPLQQSRWSDDTTLTSPTVLTTPGLRTSFASLLGEEGSQYPACFFEDDDDDDCINAEVAPLRRKLRWHRSNIQKRGSMEEGREKPRRNGFRLILSVLLCNCCDD